MPTLQGGYLSQSPYPDTTSQSMYEMQRRQMEREMTRRNPLDYGYNITDTDDAILRSMMVNMSPRSVISEIERSIELCYRQHDMKEVARLTTLKHRVSELSYMQADRDWTPAELKKIESHTDGEFDINTFLKKVKPIKLKQEE